MKKMLLTLTLVTLMIALAFFSACTERDEPKPFNPADYEGANVIIDSSNNFAFDMYNSLSKDENLFFSPYSITTAMGMAYEGAKGQTATEMEQVLDLPSNDQDRWNMTHFMQSKVNGEHDDYELSTANAYWLRKDEALNPTYKNIIEQYYMAYGKELDFRGDPTGSKDTINQWVEDRTNDKVKDLLQDGDITDDTYLILTNAIHFKANWKYQFPEDATRSRTFYTSTGGDIQVETMNMCDEDKKLKYMANDDVKLLQLPYKGEELSMYVLLPKVNDITSVEDDLSHDYLNKLINELDKEWVDVYLPKFKFEIRYQLGAHLSDMGMPTAFGYDADFTGIADDGHEIMIAKVIHKAFVDVNEEGTEAAAATAVLMEDKSGWGSSPTPQPKEFNADHPFIFFIKQEQTNQILFMGKVEDPTA